MGDSNQNPSVGGIVISLFSKIHGPLRMHERSTYEALLGGLYVPSLNFKHNSLPCPCQYLTHLFVISCHFICFMLLSRPAMSLVGVVPQEGLYNFIDQILKSNLIYSVKN